ncbi:MAG: hypothetical protein ACE5GK_03420 [Nitrospiria bacterium]
MNRYIYENHRKDREYERLRLIEQALDPETITRFEKVGIGKQWHCLELGPGAGSIMRWLGQALGKEGRVVGIDKEWKQACRCPC